MDLVDVIIIGGGCAGLTASIYCARAGLNTHVFVGGYETRGGSLAKTSLVENFPGFPEPIMGMDLIQRMEEQALLYNVKMIEHYVTRVTPVKLPEIRTDIEFYEVEYNNGQIMHSPALIIATGSTPNKLGLEREDEFWGNGISSCATCDGPLFRNKRIAVVGGGDSAMTQALFLERFAPVTVIYRGEKLSRPSAILFNRVVNSPRITIMYNTHVVALNSRSGSLDSITLSHPRGLSDFPIDGLFYGLGSIPNTELFPWMPKRDGHLTHSLAHRGVFVAGDVGDGEYDQAVVAAGSGCKAALRAQKYIASLT
jgi:thioredoxin reductase (NADPH)